MSVIEFISGPIDRRFLDKKSRQWLIDHTMMLVRFLEQYEQEDAELKKKLEEHGEQAS